MPSKIWDKYKKIKELNTNSNIKTYLAEIEIIIKEILPKNFTEYFLIKEKLERIKNIIKIYDIIEDNEKKLYVIINNNDEIISKFDNLILSEEIYIKEEGLFIGQGNPVSKNEISDLLKFEESMCKISFERIEDKIIKGKGTGFFCEISGNFPIKYGLFTNNHVLNEYNLKLGSTKF